MRDIILILFTCLQFSLSVYAQKDYERGYIVTNSNDTLVGLVKDRKQPPFGKLYKKVYFKKKYKKKKYRPNQIIAYKQGEREFESVWVDVSGHLINEKYTSIANRGEKKFLKVIEKGYVTYSQRDFEDSDSDYIDQISLFKRAGEDFFVRVTQGVFGLRKKSLITYFSDCPELVNKIENDGLKTPIEIIKFYNSWKSNPHK